MSDHPHQPPFGAYSPFSELAKQASMQPQEQLLELKKNSQKIFVGVPKEITFQENRVPLTPDTVQLLCSLGHEVVIEANAGKGASFSDNEYSEAGAAIAYNPAEVYKADIVLKVDPPTREEIELMRPNQVIISALQMMGLNEEYINSLIKKRVTAVAYEYMKDRSGSFSLIRSMSEIAGSTSILIGAEYLSSLNGGRGDLLGGISGIPSSEVVIIGAGTVGEFAAKTAIGLGASVKVFDNSIPHLRRLQENLGQRIYTSIIQPSVLGKALEDADLAIGALRSDDGRSPNVVSEEMVKRMKPGSVIVDVSIDQGGCFDTSEMTTHTRPTYKKYDVIHYCVPNIPSRVARTASQALSHIFGPVLIGISDAGGFGDYLWQRAHFRDGIYVYKGILVNRNIGRRLELPFKDLDLLIGAHM